MWLIDKKIIRNDDKFKNMIDELVKYVQESNITYQNYIEFLLRKYKGVQNDFYVIWPKGKDGLFQPAQPYRTENRLVIHHIMEHRIGALGNRKVVIENMAKDKRYIKYQNKEYLCYCNTVEHLICHILIDKYYSERGNTSNVLGLLKVNVYDKYLNEKEIVDNTLFEFDNCNELYKEEV